MCKMYLLLSISYWIPYLSLATGPSLSSGCVSTILHHFYIKLSIIEPARNVAVTIFRVRLIWYSFYELNVLAANADTFGAVIDRKEWKEDCWCPHGIVFRALSVSWVEFLWRSQLRLKVQCSALTSQWRITNCTWPFSGCSVPFYGGVMKSDREKTSCSSHGLGFVKYMQALCVIISSLNLNIVCCVACRVTTQGKTKKICENKRFNM